MMACLNMCCLLICQAREVAVAEKAAEVTVEECSLEQRRLQLDALATRLEAAQKQVNCHMS